jgi:hypothetical protein
MRQRFGRQLRRVCSGISMPNLYRFHRDTGHATESPAIAARLAQAPELSRRTRSSTAPGSRTPDPLCAAALDSFVSILGETANLMPDAGTGASTSPANPRAHPAGAAVGACSACWTRGA